MSSSNTSIAATVANINQSLATFSKCWSAFLFSFGVVGHSLSVYVFTRRTFRSNPCTQYFLALTIVGCLIVYGTIPLRILQFGFNIDVFTLSLPVCKILSYILACARVLPSWFIVLACIDR
ncbi:unnamed protein product, partial [Rotaria sp. Silwood1]